MVKKAHNLSSAPLKKNTSFLRRSVLFPFKLIKKMFMYFFEGLKQILMIPVKSIIYFYFGLEWILNNTIFSPFKNVKDKQILNETKNNKVIKITNKAQKEQERLQRIEEKKRKKENKIALKAQKKLEKKKQPDNNKNIDKKALNEAKKAQKEQERLQRIEEKRRNKEYKVALKAQKKLEKKKQLEKKEDIDRKTLNEATKAQKEQERLQRIEEKKRKKEAKIALLEKKKLNKRKIQNNNYKIRKKDIDKKTLKEINRIKKEQQNILKKEQKFKRIEEAKRLKELKNKELDIQKQKKIELKLQKKEAKRKKAEDKIIAKAEKKKLKEKQLIEKIETESKIRDAKNNELKRRKENALKIKKAQIEQKEKKKEEKNIPLKQKIKKWYKNLAFVRYRENKAEMERQVLLINFEGEDAVRSEQKIYFKYVAKKLETGELERGVFAAFSKLEVHSYLLAEGYEVYEITPQRNYGQDVLTRFVRGKIKRADLVFFLTQLSTFLKSGLPLLEAIKILEKQTDKRKYKNLYKSLNYELTMGENFSSALEKQGDSFPRLLVNMIKSSELSGNLPEVLDDMATYYDEMNKTRKQMKSAMTYPLVIFVFATGVIIFILIFVIPEFVGIYKEMNAELPTITKIIIETSNFLRKNIFYLLGGLFALFLFFKALYNSVKAFRTIVQWVMMHVAVFGKIIIYNEVTTFTKTFGSLLNHNVFITDSMEVLSKITNNEIYKMLIFDTITNLAKGGIISNAFKNHWAFPVIAYEMLLTGEKTGELGDMMMKVSDYFQLQHKNSVTQIKTFIEPLMIVFLTVLVGIILMSVILPMFNMYTEIM